MDALDILRQMHIDAKESFAKINRASPDERGGLWAKLRPELVLHEQMEERFVYDPMMKEVGDHDAVLASWHSRHEREVRDAESLINGIGALDARESGFLDKMRQLESMLDRHIQQEQDEFWPRIREVWGAQHLEDAGRPIAAAKAAVSAGATVSSALSQANEAIRGAARGITGQEHAA